MTAAAVDRVVSRLTGVRAVGGGFSAKCPAHDDRQPSLSIAEGNDGRALLHCKAGCRTEDVLQKMGLDAADLFEERTESKRVVAEYEYRDEAEALRYVVVRFLPKDFRQKRPDGAGGWLWNVQGVDPLPYRLPELLAADPSAPVLIPEGEKDVDRLRTLGLQATTNHGGAGKWKPELSKHLRGRRVVILPDNDEAGRDHARKVAAALQGIAADVRTLELPDLPAKADVSDFLMTHGAERFRELLEAAMTRPAAPAEVEQRSSEIVTVDDLTGRLDELYTRGFDRGVSLGIRPLDEFFRLRPRELTIVTGIPGHGKSGFLDQVIVNVARLHKWSFGVFSAENLPLERHLAALAEKVTGKPFSEGPSPRMTVDELRIGIEFLRQHVYLIRPKAEETNVTHILELARTLVQERGVKALIVDPWNELDHSRPASLTETEYISQSLTKIRTFTRENNVHFFVVVHPTKLPKPRDDDSGKYNPPTPYDCAGSAHWYNKADNALTIWRDVRGDRSTVQIHVQKIRFREVGRVGVVEVTYDRKTGRYEA